MYNDMDKIFIIIWEGRKNGRFTKGRKKRYHIGGTCSHNSYITIISWGKCKFGIRR